MTPHQQLLHTIRLWDAAMTKNDVDEIAQFMHEDWIIVGTEGGITTKQEFLMWIRSGSVTHHEMSSEELHLKIYGESAVVVSRGTSAGLYDGKPFNLFEWSANTFIFRDGEWRCVLTMLTPAAKPPTE